MVQKEYELLHQPGDLELSSPILTRPKRLLLLVSTLITILILSLSVNVLLLQRALSPSPPPPAVILDSEISKYAKLARTVPHHFHQDAIYTSHNRTIANAAWAEVKIDLGLVALSDAFVKEHDLMPAQRFSWDAGKGIYLINAWHNLHCLRMLHIAIVEAHDQVPLSRNFGHLTHCLDSFRQDFLCDADDTPRWTGFDAFPTTGKGQERMCRDWGKLEEWAREHTACYDSYGSDIVGYPEVEHYRKCPEGSGYTGWEKEEKQRV